MRTGKIGLRKFLYERKVPDVRDSRCGCRRGEETVRHVLTDVLTECPRFKEMRKTMWAREVRKARRIFVGQRRFPLLFLLHHHHLELNSQTIKPTVTRLSYILHDSSISRDPHLLILSGANPRRTRVQ